MNHTQTILDAIFHEGSMVEGKILSKDKTTMAILKDKRYLPYLDNIPLSQVGGSFPNIDANFKPISISDYMKEKFFNILLVLDAMPSEKITIELTGNSNYPVRISTEQIEFYLAPLSEDKGKEEDKEEEGQSENREGMKDGKGTTGETGSNKAIKSG